MKTFFDGIQWLFENIFFVPQNYLRALELKSWWAANTLNWIFILVGFVALVYWVKQLMIYEEKGEENQDTTAHSFLK